MDRLPDDVMRIISTKLFYDDTPIRSVAPARLVCKNWATALLEGVPMLSISNILLPALAGKFTGVRALIWEDCVTSRADETYFPSRIEKLSLLNADIKCNEIASAFPEVKKLVFKNCTISGIHLFAAMTSLTRLVVDTPVHINYSVIGKLSSLTSLSIKDNDLHVLPPGVTRLSRLTNLDLTGCYSIEEARAVAKIPSLRSLDISESILQIEGLPDRLDTLIMHNTCEWPSGLFADNMRRSLTSLDINENDATAELFQVDNRFRPIGTLLALTTLCINSSELKRANVRELKELSALVNLDLSDSGNPYFHDYLHRISIEWDSLHSSKHVIWKDSPA